MYVLPLVLADTQSWLEGTTARGRFPRLIADFSSGTLQRWHRPSVVLLSFSTWSSTAPQSRSRSLTGRRMRRSRREGGRRSWCGMYRFDIGSLGLLCSMCTSVWQNALRNSTSHRNQVCDLPPPPPPFIQHDHRVLLPVSTHMFSHKYTERERETHTHTCLSF